MFYCSVRKYRLATCINVEPDAEMQNWVILLWQKAKFSLK